MAIFADSGQVQGYAPGPGGSQPAWTAPMCRPEPGTTAQDSVRGKRMWCAGITKRNWPSAWPRPLFCCFFRSSISSLKKGKERKEAMSLSLTSSVSSIFVSAMCFFAATFAVFAISKIDMISSLCLLMARGAIISMLVVMFIVPSVLLVFDKLIIKTTLGCKKGKRI